MSADELLRSVVRAVVEETVVKMRDELRLLLAERIDPVRGQGGEVESLLTVARVAEKCEVTEPTVRLWIQRGDLKAIRMGRTYRVRSTDLAAFLVERSGSSASGAAMPDVGQTASLIAMKLRKSKS